MAKSSPTDPVKYMIDQLVAAGDHAGARAFALEASRGTAAPAPEPSAAVPLGHATMAAALAQGSQQAPASEPYASADLLDLATLQKMSLPEYEEIRSTPEGRKRLDDSYAAQGLPAVEEAKS